MISSCHSVTRYYGLWPHAALLLALWAWEAKGYHRTVAQMRHYIPKEVWE